MEFILEHIAEWLLGLAGTATCGITAALYARYRAVCSGLQGLLRAEIIRGYEKYTDRGHCPIYAKEALTKAYKAYHDLGGNDVATGLYKETMALPSE